MRKDYRITGSGGQGVIMLSVLLTHAYGVYEGFEVAQTQSYGPEARGGACKAEVVVCDGPIDYVKVLDIDIFVAFNRPGFEKYRADIGPDTTIFADTTLLGPELLSGYRAVHAIEATGIAEREFKPFVANVVMFGFMAAKLSDLSLASAERAVEALLPAPSRELNLAALRRGYEMGVS